MKKKVMFASLFVVAIAAASNVQAQRGFNLSVKATPQFSFLQNSTDNDDSRYEKMATFNTNFGVGAGYNFTPTQGIAIDVLYSLQGQKYKMNGTEYNQRVNYIKIPLMYAFSSNPNKMVSFLGKIGPQVSFLTSSDLSYNDGATINDDTNDQYEKATFGGAASLGAQFRMSRRLFLTTGLRFDYDFTNAENEERFGFPANRATTNNMTTGLQIGFKYSL